MALQAVSGQHKAFFPGDIYNGVLEVVTPDGRQLFSRPLGIAYDDGSNTVFIATLTNAVGYLVGSNQVVYRGAFGTLGDLICTYHRNGFESDAVFRQQPPAPGSMGLNPDTTTLQMVTEFFNTTDPEQIPAGSDDWYGLEDQTLKFGKLKMGQGRAFVTPAVNSPTASTRVYKSWLRLNNRKFLIEEVPLSDVAADLNALPLSASSERPNGKALKFASNQPHFPASHAIVGDTNHMLLASADLKTEPGFVLDYTEIDEDQTSITFQSGQTYLISGSVNVGDSSENGSSVIFQGGAVLKFTTNAINGINYDQLDATYPSPTDPPVILTSADDNRFGVTIPTSSGVPVILTNVIYLPNLGNGGNEPENLYFYYAGMGMQVTDPGYVDNCRFFNCYLGIFEWFPGGLIQAGDCQFINCCQGVQATYGEIDLNNCLFSQCQTGIDFSADGGIMDGDGNYIEYAGIGYQFNFQYITADHVGSFLQWPYFSEDEVLSPVVANSIFTSTPIFQSVLFFSWGDTTNQINSIVQYPAEYSFIRTLPGRPYVSAGQGNYYIASNSICHNGGVANPGFFPQMTTYAPQDGGSPDINGVDIGYHYPTNEDSTMTGVPDWWIWQWFGNYNENGTNLDSQGNTLLSDYENALNPNVIQFSIAVTNNYINTSSANVQLNVTGNPYYIAVCVDDTNFQADALWQPYSGSNMVVNLGTTEGWHGVCIGLRGHGDDPINAVWQWKRLKLDLTPPALFITNPSNTTVNIPMIQLQGFSPEALNSISYDLTNAAGLLTNQQILVLDQAYDTNTFEFTTNTFQAYDVILTNGMNTFTLHATDLAGNTTTTNYSVTLDYSSKTNPPNVKVTWPQNGTQVSGNSFTMDGQVEDATITIAAIINDSNGDTNTARGLVERSGRFWVENLPLNSGTNTVILTATDTVGNVTTTNFNVIQSAVTLTVNPVSGSQLWQPTVNLSGTISDTTYAIWVNGVKGHNNGDGTWSASNVPVDSGGTASFTATGYAPTEQQPDGSYGN